MLKHIPHPLVGFMTLCGRVSRGGKGLVPCQVCILAKKDEAAR